MTNREKVIIGLECHYEGCERKNGSICPYWENDSCGKQLVSDALALLKEHEEENGNWITIWQEDYTSISARCSICNRISERPLGGYCKWCGAKMNQEMSKSHPADWFYADGKKRE